MHHSQMNSEVRRLIADGTVLPAPPLALDAGRKLDTLHQRALTRYYIDAGAGGLAVGTALFVFQAPQQRRDQIER